MNLKSILAMSAALAALGTASAAVFVTGHTGSNTEDPLNAGTVGIKFFAHQDEIIDSLAVYAPNGITAGSLTVSLWRSSDITATAAVTIPNGPTSTPDADGYIYLPITPEFVSLNTPLILSVTGYNTTGTGIGDSSGTGPVPSYDTALGYFIDGGFWSGTGNPFDTFNTLVGSTRFSVASFTIQPVPEPEVYASIAGLALVGFGLYRRQARK